MADLPLVLKDGSEVGASVADKINAIIETKIPAIEAVIASGVSSSGKGWVFVSSSDVAANTGSTAIGFSTIERQDATGAINALVDSINVVNEGLYKVLIVLNTDGGPGVESVLNLKVNGVVVATAGTGYISPGDGSIEISGYFYINANSSLTLERGAIAYNVKSLAFIVRETLNEVL